MAEHFIDYYPKVKAEITVQLTEHLEARRMLSDDYAELKTAKLKTTRLKDA